MAEEATVLDGTAGLIEADGVVNQRVWTDKAPKSATKPYVTLRDAISVSKQLAGDGHGLMLVRQFQADLWESYDAEDPAVLRRLYAALDGARITVTGATTTRLSVDGVASLPEESDGIAHHALTISVRHDPAAL